MKSPFSRLAYATLYSMLLLVLPIASTNALTFEWNTSTLIEGGWDYSTFEGEETFVPNGDETIYTVGYAAVDGAEVDDIHDLAYADDGSLHYVAHVSGIGLQYGYMEDATSGLWDRLETIGNVGPLDVEIEIDSKGNAIIAYSTSLDAYLVTNKGGSWNTVKVDENLLNKEIALEIDSRDRAHLITNAMNGSGTRQLVHSQVTLMKYTSSSSFIHTRLFSTVLSTVILDGDSTITNLSGMNMIMDSKGNMHIIYRGDNTTVTSYTYYHVIGTNGSAGITWSGPNLISLDLRHVGPSEVALAVDDEDYIYFWPAGGDSYSSSQGILKHKIWIYDSTLNDWNPQSDEITTSTDYGYRVHGDMEVDKQGNIHYFYMKEDGAIIHIYSEDDFFDRPYSSISMEWSEEVVDYVTTDGTDDNIRVSGVLDEKGGLHMIYNDMAAPTYLRYSQAWWSPSTELIAEHSEEGIYNDVLVDDLGQVHAVYYGEYTDPNTGMENGNLYYALRDTSGTWTTETIDSDGDVGEYVSFVMDSSGYLHVVYYLEYDTDGYTYEQIKYANNRSGSWDTERLETTKGRGKYASITIDSTDQLHVSYYDEDNGQLLYATKGSSSLTWNIETVTAGIDTGLYTSIGFHEGSSSVYISHFNNATGKLDLSYGSYGSWSTITVKHFGMKVGHYTSLDIHNDTLAITYYSPVKKQLMYVNGNISAGYPVMNLAKTIDGFADVGISASLALDTDGYAHIAYHDNDNGNLKYITNKSGLWKSDTIYTENDAGEECSLALVPGTDIPVIVFTEDGSDEKFLFLSL